MIRSSSSKLISTVLFGAAACIAVDRVPAANNKSHDAVQEALRDEVDGSLEQRAARLQDALKVNPASKEAHWHVGELQHDGRWIDYAKLAPELADTATLNEYRGRRDQAPLTRDGQIELADWCRAHKLKDQERAHITAALELSDDSADGRLRTRLGQKLVNGSWVSDGELKKQKKDRATAQRQLKAWQAPLKRIAKKLESPSDKVREAAKRELLEIEDAAAIPAMEWTLAGAGLESEAILVQVLDQFNTFKAVEPMARLAVFSEWASVRKAAAAGLKDRPAGAYAPLLLSSLQTPIESKINLLVGADGVHLTQTLSSETQTKSQQFERNLSTFVTTNRVNVRNSITGEERDRNRLDRAFERAELDAKLEAQRVETEVAQENRAIEDQNERVCAVLAEATGAALPADPTKWWEWWRDYNQLSDSGKSLERDYSYETRTEYVESAPIVETAIPVGSVVTASQTECLVAGTPVWTDRGLSAIETVKVGDLVLSKNPETGELAYQPVVRTSVREPQPVFTVTTDGGEIRATGGHVFWVSGCGWTKLRDVKAGQRFHGAAKPAVIRGLREEGQEKTYNLVVADFHTYFVGSDLVLSHDLTFARPIDATVPGMAAR